MLQRSFINGQEKPSFVMPPREREDDWHLAADAITSQRSAHRTQKAGHMTALDQRNQAKKTLARPGPSTHDIEFFVAAWNSRRFMIQVFPIRALLTLLRNSRLAPGIECEQADFLPFPALPARRSLP